MSLGARLRGLRTERGIRQKALAAKAGLTPSLVSQIESDKLSPSLHTLGRLAAALGVPIGAFFEQPPNGRLHVGRRQDYAVVSFDSAAERWHVLAAGLFRGKVRAVVSTLARRGPGVPPERVLLEPGQMKLMYVLQGRVALLYNGERHVLAAGDSAYLDGGIPHGWENLGPGAARTLWVITGKDE
ncbi:MAG TPA: XRE family transcriptional regulator [Methylomirabilota bacterium]|jgi:transcriptional regulator with XRE-family HTH domain|nr:XRE family transcriptional regulator [Methylomirabilota bacterium]